VTLSRWVRARAQGAGGIWLALARVVFRLRPFGLAWSPAVMEIDAAMVRPEFDAQVRRGLHTDGSGGLGERVGPVVRWTATSGGGWSGVTWSELDAGTADGVIADQVAFFRSRAERFEWKLYSYDQPPDLGERLLAAGFVGEDAESLMVADAGQIAGHAGTGDILPDGVRLVTVTDEAGLDLMIELHDQVFGADPQLRAALVAQLRSPETTVMLLAMAGDEPVCSARVEFGAGTDFAGLWGGGTLRQWRGRGIYRALVGYRARLAVDRGYRYLQVDASPESRPILERLGFVCLAQTTPYVWSPS
jgi:GNAT superfamily N-acetyltransferase